jgi:hypothetical protein
VDKTGRPKERKGDVTTATPSSQPTTPEVECVWCDQAATAVYVSKSTGEEIAFCRSCDPIDVYEPDACAEHPAGCGSRHDKAVA